MKRFDICQVAGLCPSALVLVAGCHFTAVPPVTPTDYDVRPAEVTAPAPTPAPAPAPAPQATPVHVSERVLTACRIDDAKTGQSPLFAFDSAAISRDDRRLLNEVAHCFTVGPLAERYLELVGRTDPRGTEAHNLRLGGRRATSVERYLRQHGMLAM